MTPARDSGAAAAPEPPAFVRGPLLTDAWELARVAHEGQTRPSDGGPYLRHPVEVAELLRGVGLDDDGIVAAALLHDVVEHTGVETDDVYGRFGEEVGRLVEALTEPEGVEPYERRKELHRAQVEAAGRRAVAIYVADKLAKLREVRAQYARAGERAADALKAPLDVRVRLWEEDLAMARRAFPELPLVARLEAELAALAGQREADR